MGYSSARTEVEFEDPPELRALVQGEGGSRANRAFAQIHLMCQLLQFLGLEVLLMKSLMLAYLPDGLVYCLVGYYYSPSV